MTIRTKTDDINTSLDLTLKTGVQQLDEAGLIVPASLQQQESPNLMHIGSLQIFYCSVLCRWNLNYQDTYISEK